MSNLKEGYYHGSYALWKNDLNGLSFNPQTPREWVCQEGEKKRSLLIHASIFTTHASLKFVYSFSFLSFLSCSTSFSFVPPIPLFTIHSYPILYCLPWWNLLFLPFNFFWLLMCVLPRLPIGLSAAPPLPLLWMCWLHHSPFQDKIASLVSYLSLFFHYSHLDKDYVFPSPTYMACIKWSLPILSSFKWDVIPTWHFSPKKFEREPQNRPPLSLHYQTTPFICLDPWPISHILAGYKKFVHTSLRLNLFLFGLHTISTTSVFVWFCCTFWLVFISCGVKDMWAFGLIFPTFNPFFGLGIAWTKTLIFWSSPCSLSLCLCGFCSYHIISSCLL